MELKSTLSIKKWHKALHRLKVEWWVALHNNNRMHGDYKSLHSAIKLNSLLSLEWILVEVCKLRLGSNNSKLQISVMLAAKNHYSEVLLRQLHLASVIYLGSSLDSDKQASSTNNKQDRTLLYLEASKLNMVNSSKHLPLGSSNRHQHSEVILVRQLVNQHCLGEPNNSPQVIFSVHRQQQLELAIISLETLNQG